MNITAKDITSCTLLKSSREGEVLELTTLGGLHLIMLKKPNGDVETLSSSTSSLRSQALANRKRPDLEIPVIVKSAEKKSESKLVFGSSEKKPSPKAQAHNNLSDAKHSLLTAKQKIGKLINKPKTMKLGEDEATRKVDTLSTQRAVRRNQSKLQKQKPSFMKRPTPPSSGEMSQEVTRKLPIKMKSAEAGDENHPSLVAHRASKEAQAKSTPKDNYKAGQDAHDKAARLHKTAAVWHEKYGDKKAAQYHTNKADFHNESREHLGNIETHNRGVKSSK